MANSKLEVNINVDTRTVVFTQHDSIMLKPTVLNVPFWAVKHVAGEIAKVESVQEREHLTGVAVSPVEGQKIISQ